MPTSFPPQKPKPSWITSWKPSAGEHDAYQFFDGIRGVALLLVLICHFIYYNPEGGVWQIVIGKLAAVGSSGVNIFFALSGFLISWPFWKLKNTESPRSLPQGYFWRRFFKIYPPFFLSILFLLPGYIYIGRLTGKELEYGKVALQWLTGLGFVMPISSIINPVMWTLIIEVQFYAVLPLFFWAMRRLSYRSTLIGMGICLVLFPYIARWVYMANGITPTLHPIIDSNFPSSLRHLGPGVILAGLYVRGYLEKANASLADLSALLLTGLLLFRASHGILDIHVPVWGNEIWDILLTASATGLNLYITDSGNRRRRWLSFDFLALIGLISYEWYLLHQPFGLWMRTLASSAHASMQRYLFIIGTPVLVSLILSILLYRYISLPILRYGRKRFGHRLQERHSVQAPSTEDPKGDFLGSNKATSEFSLGDSAS